MRAPDRGLFGLPARRPVLGLEQAAAPPILFAVGAALGPDALGLIDAGLLGRAQIVVGVALAVVGVYVGLGLRRHRGPGGALTVATVECAITAGLTAAGLWLLSSRWQVPLPLDLTLFATVAALAAAVSAAPGEASPLARVADLDDLVVVLAGSAVLAAIAGPGLPQRLAIAGLASVLTGVAGHWLFERATPAERGVFLGGAILLLAGIGSYLLVSPLLTGFLGAIVWVALPGEADRITAADLQRLQHVLVALLLVVAGAWVSWSAATLWMGCAVVLLRLVGKLTASLALARFVGVASTELASTLLPPGLIGIAFALDAARLVDAGGGILVGSVVTAVVLGDLAASWLPFPAGRESA